jgi:hypothetical protein
VSSLLRRLQRARQRRNGTFEAPPQPYFTLRDGGYCTLRPTKGWIRISGKRVRAQYRMQRLFSA